MTAAVCSSRRVKREADSLLVASEATTARAPSLVLAVGGSGQATVTYAAPTHLANGSAITEAPSYRVYYAIRVSDVNPVVGALTLYVTQTAGVYTKTVTGLAPGTYVFAVASENGYGVGQQSSFTEPVTVT